MLRAKANITARTSDFGISVLHYVLDKKQPQMCAYLVRAKAEVNANSESGMPLATAAAKGNEEVVQLLLANKASISATGWQGEVTPSAVGNACKQGHVSIARTLLQAGGILDAGSVYHGLMQDDSELDKLIMAQQNWATAVDEGTGMYAVHVAAVEGNHCTTKMLCDGGADVDARTKEGLTALMICSQHGHKGVARCLLTYKADAMATDKQGDTPLHYAGWYEKPKIAKILVEVGGAAMSKNNKGEEPRNPDTPECCIS